MGMKKSAVLMSMFALAGMMSEGNSVHDEFMGRIPTKEEEKERLNKLKKQKELDRINRLKTKGVKEFIYYKQTKTEKNMRIVIYARNKKNADRKAINKGVSPNCL